MKHDDLLDYILAAGLMLLVGVVVVGSFWLSDHGKSVPDALIAIGSAALGSVGTMLTTRNRRTVDPTADDE